MKRSSGKGGATLSLLDQDSARIAGHRLGELVKLDEETAYVTYAGNPHGHLPARSLVELPEKLGARPLPVLLVFEEERSDLPIILGVLRSPSGERAARAADGQPAPEKPREATLDGKRVVLTAEDEIVLRCGRASITLRRNGRVVIRGAYVETRAEGVNRVKGGSVQIN